MSDKRPAFGDILVKVLAVVLLFGMWGLSGYATYVMVSFGGNWGEILTCLIPFAVMSWIILAIFIKYLRP